MKSAFFENEFSMWIPGQPEVNRAFAVLCAERWGADPATIAHIGDFGNSVYSFDCAGEKVILRLTDPADRSKSVNYAELDFLLHLRHCGVSVSTPILSRFNRLIETVSVENSTLLASVFEYAPGVQVTPDSPYWEEKFFRAWGRTLAQIHWAATTFEPAGEHRRWQWMDEVLIADARRLIPADDRLSLRELDTVMQHLSSLPAGQDTYGLIHADFGTRNFHYAPDGTITAFDFGNCCYHWFVSDITIALSTLRHYPRSEREQYRSWMLAGYQEIFPVDPFLLSQSGWFMRLRILYVYLDRLMLFGAAPDESQQEILQRLRQQVHDGFDW
jgi:amicoumacin kinase